MPDDSADRTIKHRGESFESAMRDELAPELQLVRNLGKGPVASVWLAREPALRRLVAVKVLDVDLASRESAVRRFEREAQSAARIAHPNVVTVYRVGRFSDGLPYLVMQYVKGRSLDAVLDAEGPLDIAPACGVLGDVASAVAAGHRKQVIHRDIKPSNVMVDDASGTVFVFDFGIAAVIASGDEDPVSITTVGRLVGDPQYMSPERLLGESPGERADVYNLGLLAYELLAGRGPFEADSNRGWTEVHLTGEPPSLAELGVAVDPRLEELLLRCLAKNPDHRPAATDVEEIAREMTDRPGARAGGTVSGSGVSRSVELAPSPGAVRGAGSPAEAPPAGMHDAAAPPLAPPPSPTPAPPGLLAPAGERLRFDVLGGLDLVAEDAGRVLSVVAQPRRAALLAYLAVGTAGRFARRDRIVSVFWPDLDDEKARHALRQAIYVLRGSLGSEAIVSRGDDEVGLAPDALWCDAVAFERALDEDRPDCAMELYRGQLLPGFYLNDSIEFEHWLDDQRDRLERLATDAAWQLATRSEAAGDLAGALQWGRRAIELAPFDEPLARQLIELHVRAGDRAGALTTFESFARRLAEELEAEPMPETLELAERVRAGRS